MKDASPAAAVSEHFEAVGFNCKRAFFEAQADYTVHVGLQQKHLCSVAATQAVMALANILRRWRRVQLAVTGRNVRGLSERFGFDMQPFKLGFLRRASPCLPFRQATWAPKGIELGCSRLGLLKCVWGV